MVHRALLGSLERFIGVLIEQYSGLFPLWLAPVQIKVLTITDKQAAFASEIARKLEGLNVRVEVDESAEKIGQKIREASIQKIPYLVIVGDKEVEKKLVSVRKQDGQNLGTMSLEEFMAVIGKEIEERRC